MKILITGACGRCGTALAALAHEKVFFDCLEPAPELSGEHFVQGNLSDPEALAAAMRGCDAVVHGAASSSPDSAWEQVLHNNIEGMANVMNAAHAVGADPVVFASSNHVVGMYELENAPGIYELGHGIVVDRHAPVRPDSHYGVSKAIGEDIGHFYAENGGPRCCVIRIGAVRTARDDHPYAYAEEGVRKGLWQRGSEAYQLKEKRLKALWQSRRDFVQMVNLCLQYEGPAFDIFYGVSDNPRRWLDIEHARAALGYEPRDNAELWTAPPEMAGTGHLPGERIPFSPVQV